MCGRQTWSVVVLLILLGISPLFAQEDFRSRPYDSLRAGEDAYRLAEEQRRNNVANQAQLNDYLRQRATWQPVYGENIIYYRSPYGNSYDYPPGYGTSGYSSGYGGYGYSYQSSVRRGIGLGSYSNSYTREQVIVSPGVSTGTYYQNYGPGGAVYREGYVAGYVRNPSIPYLRQPIGQRQVQTGPNRWESHPVYAEDPPALRETPVAGADDDRRETGYSPLSPVVRPRVITPREY